ncbi:MAG: hypothetical protein CMO55_07025 [Verrucomicrobiales bacterium]|nr:hypothetical protein [Verrucomicrobiales bacterium]
MGRIDNKTFLLLGCLASVFFSACSDEKKEPPATLEAKEQTAPESPQYIKNTLKWQTASESKIFGFYVYRGETQDGPFDLLNPRPVSATGTTDEHQNYQFADTEAVPGKTYYYYLETLDYNNRRKQYSPVFPYQTPAS